MLANLPRWFLVGLTVIAVGAAFLLIFPERPEYPENETLHTCPREDRDKLVMRITRYKSRFERRDQLDRESSFECMK